MTTLPLPFRVRRSFFCFLVACSAACVATEAEDPPSSETDGEDAEDSGDEAPTTDDPSDVDTTGDDPTDVDTTGDDPTGEDPTGEDPTGEGTVPLGDDVLFFIREIEPSVDEVWMYDVGTDSAERVVDLGDAAVTSIAISPDRGALAFATTFETTDYQESESIWGVAHGPDGFGQLIPVMPAIPAPVGVGSGWSQRVDDLSWHPDGSAIWFSHAISFDIAQPGGGALGRVDIASGDFTLFTENIGSCTVNTSPAPAPDGSVLLAVRGVCTDSAQEGVVSFALPIAGEPQMLVPTPNATFTSPEWVADGSGIAYAAAIDYDSDGDGSNDVYGDAIMLIDTATAEQYVVLAPSPTAFVWGFAMSPDATRFAVCISEGGARNLLLVDYSGDQPTTRWLTDDASSCHPSW